MTRVLVTGASGFVGSVLCQSLAHSGYLIRAALRTDRPLPATISERAVVGAISATTDWSAALRDVDCVIHLAARAHVLRDAAVNSDQYLEVNARGTRQLAAASADAGVPRFVFLSSVKVNGEETSGQAYTAFDTPQPCDAYGRSKWLAEQAVWETTANSSTKSVIVRPPLVYGPGVRANFLRLLSWVDKELPLPFASITNRRSLVSVWNLCDLLTKVLAHPRAPNRTWMVSDCDDLSTPDLIRRIGSTMGRRVRLWSAPLGALRTVGVLTGRRAEVKRLCGSLVVNTAPTRKELDWCAPLSVQEGLARTVDWYLSERRAHDA